MMKEAFNLYDVTDTRPAAVAAQVDRMTAGMPWIKLPCGEVLVEAVANTLVFQPEHVAQFLRHANSVIDNFPADFRDRYLAALADGQRGRPRHIAAQA